MEENFGVESTLYATVLLTINKSISWSLEYYLQTYTSSSGKKLYGIKIDKLDTHYNIIDTADTFSMTESYDKVTAILLYLANGLVRPLELLAMVDDWFSSDEWYSKTPTEQTSHMEV